MRALVTGCAGFVGSNLVDELLNAGDTVVGLDSFSPYYDPKIKLANLSSALANPKFTLVKLDLANDPLGEHFEGVDVVFHQAAQPGVRFDWANGMRDYSEANVVATQRTLEESRRQGVTRFVYASSSSVYGNRPTYPTPESQAPNPFSPYGVSKLAGEQLCSVYAQNWGFSTVSLRYFTVFGPRQRPDMAMHRLIQAAVTGSRFPLMGDGQQRRDFTFVSDVVMANVLAATSDVSPGSVFNIGGGSPVALVDVVSKLEEITGNTIALLQEAAPPGDVSATGASIELAGVELGWEPTTSLYDGLVQHVKWHQSTVK